MGYAAERAESIKKNKAVKRIVLGVTLCVVLVLCILSAFYPIGAWKYYLSLPKIEKRQEGDLRVCFVDVGQGDATIIQLPDNKVMLIDGGNSAESTSLALLRHLNAMKIKTIDYLVLTHADADHCGGLVQVLEHKQVKKVYLPLLAEDSHFTYQAFEKTMREKNCEFQYGNASVHLGSKDGLYILSFLYPYAEDVANYPDLDFTDDNKYSAVVWLDYLGQSFLFTGDAPFETEEKMIEGDVLGLGKKYGIKLSSTEVLKVSHHGSANATSQTFLEYLHIQHAVISCGKNNSYNHPSVETYQRLIDTGASIYRTDRDGSILYTVNKRGVMRVKTLK